MSSDEEKTKKSTRGRSKGKTRSTLQKRHIDQLDFKEEIQSNLTSTTKEKTPTILFELSNREWKRYERFSIVLEGAIVCKGNTTRNNKVYYNSVTYGSEFLQKGKSKQTTIQINKNESKVIDEINLANISGKRMVFIVTRKQDVHSVNNENFFITSSCTATDSINSRFKGSGMIVIFLIHSCAKKIDPSEIWEEGIAHYLKKNKPNIIHNTNNQHFQSQGQMYAFGNRADYRVNEKGSSITQYTNKKSKLDTTQTKIDETSKKYETLCANEVIRAVDSMKGVFPNIHRLISPMIDNAFLLQDDIGDINLKQVETTEVGLWQSEICVNAITKIFHTEKDITYTLITVPPQIRQIPKYKDRSDTYFLLELNETKTLGFRLNNKVSFLFSGTMITHRQHCIDGYEEDERKRAEKVPFFNVACYGNERLFRHIKTSIARVNTTKK